MELRSFAQSLMDWIIHIGNMSAARDTNIHIAVLSTRSIVVARHPHTNDAFLLDGRRFYVSRGFAEVDIRATPNFTFTLIAAHFEIAPARARSR